MGLLSPFVPDSYSNGQIRPLHLKSLSCQNISQQTCPNVLSDCYLADRYICLFFVDLLPNFKVIMEDLRAYF
jgi:hypothetical protein